MGTITRGTTAPNRLRRCDRWLLATQGWRLRRPDRPPVIADLGYGATPITAVELRDRARTVRRDARVLGVEIDPDRVAVTQGFAGDGSSFVRGGFVVPVPGRVDGVRAFSVPAGAHLRVGEGGAARVMRGTAAVRGDGDHAAAGG